MTDDKSAPTPQQVAAAKVEAELTERLSGLAADARTEVATCREAHDKAVKELKDWRTAHTELEELYAEQEAAIEARRNTDRELLAAQNAAGYNGKEEANQVVAAEAKKMVIELKEVLATRKAAEKSIAARLKQYLKDHPEKDTLESAVNNAARVCAAAEDRLHALENPHKQVNTQYSPCS